MSTLEAALSLAAKGCLVFPIVPLTKRPAITGWPERATTDAAAIRKWWSRWPDANVGVHTRGLLVLDVDGPEGHRCLGGLRLRLGLPETLTVVSGNAAEAHHYQLVYGLPPGLRGWNKPLRKFRGFEDCAKIDVRSDRGRSWGPARSTRPGHLPLGPGAVLRARRGRAGPRLELAALCRPGAEAAPSRAEAGSDEELLATVSARFGVTGPG